MDLPDQDAAINWEGAVVVDRAGDPLGRCTGVFADVDTDAVEWITVAVDEHRRLFIPALDATESGGTLRVSFARGDVLAAPRVGDEQELSKADEVRLYEHYGVAHTSAASGSVLPIGVSTPSSGPAAADQHPGEPERAPEPPVPHALTAVRPTATSVYETPPSTPAHLDEVPVPTRSSALTAPAPVDPLAELDDPLPAVHAPEPVPPSPAPAPTIVEPGQGSAPPARPTLRSAPAPMPSTGWTSASPAAPLAVVEGIVAAAGIALQVWELRARRRRRPSARAARASRQAKAGSASAVRTAAKQLTGVNAAAARTTRQLAGAASTATGSAARSGSAVTSSVAAIPPAVVRRGRRTRRSVAGGLWDVAAVGTAGTGYVLGAKAGRGRYEQIHQQAQEVAQSRPVKAVTEAVLGQPSTSGAAGRPLG